MAFRIEYTLRAEVDVDELLAWLIAQNAGHAGVRWLNGLIEAVDRLRVSTGKPGRVLSSDDEVLA